LTKLVRVRVAGVIPVHLLTRSHPHIQLLFARVLPPARSRICIFCIWFFLIIRQDWCTISFLSDSKIAGCNLRIAALPLCARALAALCVHTCLLLTPHLTYVCRVRLMMSQSPWSYVESVCLKKSRFRLALCLWTLNICLSMCGFILYLYICLFIHWLFMFIHFITELFQRVRYRFSTGQLHPHN
jgi:hypothetical protein